MLTIRNETQADRRIVEDITRRAFYNIYAPGCVEHYLVHTMRDHPDFIPELGLVAELDGQVIGNVMYTRRSSPSARCPSCRSTSGRAGAGGCWSTPCGGRRSWAGRRLSFLAVP